MREKHPWLQIIGIVSSTIASVPFLIRDFRYGPISACMAASTERTVRSVSSLNLSGTLTEAILAAPLASAAPSL